MASFNRFDDRRASYNFEKRGRSFFRGDSPLSSPLFRKKQFSFNANNEAANSVPSSLASSRDSSLDRGQDVEARGLHQALDRVRSSPKLSLKQRFQVILLDRFGLLNYRVYYLSPNASSRKPVDPMQVCQLRTMNSSNYKFDVFVSPFVTHRVRDKWGGNMPCRVRKGKPCFEEFVGSG